MWADLTILLSVSTLCIVSSAWHPDRRTYTVGSEQIDKLAEKIWYSVGPSGRNKDYLYDLSAAVRQLAPESHDSHLYALEVRYCSGS